MHSFLGVHQAEDNLGAHIWDAICGVYFPRFSATPDEDKWSVRRLAWRGPPDRLDEYRPTLVATKLRTQPGVDRLMLYCRDYLWVECKPFTHDTPDGWKDLIDETVGELDSAHPNRDVAVVVAIGLRMMAFWWSPSRAAISPQMSIQAAQPRATVWHLDQRLKCWPSGGWVDQTTGRIDLSEALTIDCLSEPVVDGYGATTRRNDLRHVEQIIESVRQTSLPAWNSAHWAL